jgi:alkanesulfonate monooxygenase SsuD/methylene tetrahydromethanopterin reductase-like flavin-dependent oxidoreductase (luciferase family)
MADYRPTVAPRGRLARLGVVLDTRNAPVRVREIAQMCDRAGIDSVWAKDRLAARGEEPRIEAWTALVMAGLGTSRITIGAHLDFAFRPPAVLAAMIGTLDAIVGGRLELTLSPGFQEQEHRMFGLEFPDTAVRTARLDEYVDVVRGLVAGRTVTSTGSFELRGAELGVASAQSGGPPLSIEAVVQVQLEAAARLADDVVVPAASVRDITVTVNQIRAACERVGRDPATLGIALEIPVSIGRTHAEAEARADVEPLFQTVGHPADVGIFGTLEECQERVIKLAHAGVRDLRCILPNTDDVPDVIAQLTAVNVGSPDVLIPGGPKSASPPPPQTWGGRSKRV